MKKVVLLIRDGWGNAAAGTHNAVSNANTPNIDKYLKEYPHTQIEASGEQVGLPAGYMGSSEVGHLNMGAGRIVIQELKRLKDTIEDGSLFQSAAFSACPLSHQNFAAARAPFSFSSNRIVQNMPSDSICSASSAATPSYKAARLLFCAI